MADGYIYVQGAGNTSKTIDTTYGGKTGQIKLARNFNEKIA